MCDPSTEVKITVSKSVTKFRKFAAAHNKTTNCMTRLNENVVTHVVLATEAVKPSMIRCEPTDDWLDLINKIFSVIKGPEGSFLGSGN